jgi:hypothetical protein
LSHSFSGRPGGAGEPFTTQTAGPAILSTENRGQLKIMTPKFNRQFTALDHGSIPPNAINKVCRADNSWEYDLPAGVAQQPAEPKAATPSAQSQLADRRVAAFKAEREQNQRAAKRAPLVKQLEQLETRKGFATKLRFANTLKPFAKRTN